MDTNEQFDLTACLRYKNDAVYMWVEDGVKVDETDLKAAADLFAEKTYPTNRNFFGLSVNPGVDNDPRLHILHARNLGDTVPATTPPPTSSSLPSGRTPTRWRCSTSR